jgi:hypothetical protein
MEAPYQDSDSMKPPPLSLAPRYGSLGQVGTAPDRSRSMETLY